MDGAEPQDEQGLRAATRNRRDAPLRSNEPPDGQKIGSFMRLFRQFLSWTLAIMLHSKPHLLDARPTLVGLLPCRSPMPTRKNSPPAPTTPCAPAPKHHRRSDEASRTMPPVARSWTSAPFAGRRRAQPTRRAPTAPGQPSGSPSPTNVSASQSPSADAPLERCSPFASASQTKR